MPTAVASRPSKLICGLLFVQKVEVELPTYDQKVANLEEKQQELVAHLDVAQQRKDGAAADWAEFQPRWGQLNDDLTAKTGQVCPGIARTRVSVFLLL